MATAARPVSKTAGDASNRTGIDRKKRERFADEAAAFSARKRGEGDEDSQSHDKCDDASEESADQRAAQVLRRNTLINAAAKADGSKPRSCSLKRKIDEVDVASDDKTTEWMPPARDDSLSLPPRSKKARTERVCFTDVVDEIEPDDAFGS
eukprot:TRINITY_DN5965_c0_g2_i1.p1 TRINITY_DN5965_c0_g2~~TRINITY_DN5965_c0_g2_i1.p1  ORF type:complete len:151 (+),score=26.80 TRINITY_DN5965_c0_g2_i1:77-529(+)